MGEATTLLDIVIGLSAAAFLWRFWHHDEGSSYDMSTDDSWLPCLFWLLVCLVAVVTKLVLI